MTGETKVLLGLGLLSAAGFTVAAVMRKPKSSSSATGTPKLPPPYTDLFTYRGRTVAVWLLTGPTVTNGVDWRYAILSQPQADILALMQQGTDLLSITPEPVTWGHTPSRELSVAEAKAQLDAMQGAQGQKLSLSLGARTRRPQTHHHMRSRWG